MDTQHLLLKDRPGCLHACGTSCNKQGQQVLLAGVAFQSFWRRLPINKHVSALLRGEGLIGESLGQEVIKGLHDRQ